MFDGKNNCLNFGGCARMYEPLCYGIDPEETRHVLQENDTLINSLVYYLSSKNK